MIAKNRGQSMSQVKIIAEAQTETEEEASGS